MKYKKFYLTFVLIILFIGAFLKGNTQTINQNSNLGFDKSWLEMIQDPDVNFYEVQNAFNLYWENRDDYKGNGWKVFKRWEYINQFRVLPDGKLQAPGYVFGEYNKYMKDAGKSASGNWTIQGPTTYVGNNTGQPTGMGRVNAIAFHPTDANTIFVGSPSGGFWKTTDGGNTWSNLSSNLPTIGVSSILVHPTDPNIIYIGSGDRDAGSAIPLGVFKSTDGGSTWTQINSTMGNVTVGAMLMLPSDPNTIIAATSGGIYKTTNGGTTWSQKAAGNFKDLQFKPGDPSVVYAVKILTPSEFHRSTNTGDSWSQITSGIPTTGIGSRMVIGVSPANGSYVYLLQINSTGGTLANILRSTDSGLNFSSVATGPNLLGYACDGSDASSQATYDLCMTVDPLNINNVFVGGINNWMSYDAGVNWTISSHWIGSSFGNPCASSVHADQHCYAWSPLNGRLYVGHDGGIHYTANGGTTWSEITNNLAITQIYRIGQGASNANYAVFGCQDNGCAGTTNGTSFYTVSGGDGMECVIDYNNTNYCYDTYYGGITRRSTTGPTGSYSNIAGNGVNGIDESGAWVSPYFLHKSDPNTMFLALKNVWRSNNIRSVPNSSVTWTKISSGETSNITAVEQSEVDLNVIYAARSGSIKRTDNANASAGSVTWTTCTVPGGITPTDIKAHPTDANIVYVTGGYKIYKSTDKGMTWTDMSGNLPALFINCTVLDKNANEGIYVGNQTSVWYKDATLTDWVLFSSGLPPVDIRELEIYYDNGNPSNNRIKCATYGRGMWQSDLIQVNAIDPTAFTATPVSLSQIDLAWTKNLSNNDVLIATSSTSTFGVPVDGVSYTAGNTLPAGGGIVIYAGPLSAFNHTSLSTGVTYYYKIWSVNGSIQYSAGLPPISATTYSHGWTSGAGSSDWFTAGNWGSGTIPTPSDNVYIPSGTSFQPQINAAGATCGNITIESGTSLSMSGSTAYTLAVSGDWINNGTFNRGIGTVEFNGSNSLQTIKGTSTTAFYILKINKGNQNNILVATSLITLNAAANPLDITSGTFKLSSASTITPFTTSAGAELFSTDGIWNNGGTINYGGFTWYNAGLLKISAGTINSGTGAGNSITYWNSGKIIIEGGALNIAGRLQPNSGTSICSYTQSGGVVTVNTMGSTSTSRAPFEINSGVPFTMSGGTIVIQRSSSNAADYLNSAATNTVTGGTLQIGNASTPLSQTIRINSTVPVYNLTVYATNSPTAQLVTNGLTVMNDLTISGGTLNANNLNLSVAGQWTNNGSFTAGSGTVTLNGTTSQIIGGSAATAFNNLTIGGSDVQLGTSATSKLTTVSNTLTINSDKKLTIPALQFLTVNGTLTNSAGTGGLVIESDVTGTGSLIENNGVSATVERYFTDDRWHYISAPVDNPLAGVFMGMYLKYWSEPTSVWTYIIDPNYVLSTDMAGYALWTYNVGTATFTGNLNTGSKSLSVTNTAGGPSANDGYNFAGNPYPSAIDWNVNDGSGWTRTNIDASIYIWNHNFGNYGVYPKGGSGTNGVDNIIPPHQGFFIHCTTGQPTGSIAVDNGARIHDAKDIYKSVTDSNPFLRLNVSGNNYSDEIILTVVPVSTTNFDGQYDGFKMRGIDSAPQLYSLAKDGTELSINSFPEDENYQVIPLGFEAGVSGNYSIAADEFSGFSMNNHVYIEDLQEGIFTLLDEAGDMYSFIASPLDEPLRFLLHLNGQLAVPENANGLNGIQVYSFGEDVYIKSDGNITGTISIYDLQGRKILTGKLNGEPINKFRLMGQHGIMVAEVVSEQGTFRQKVYVK